MLTEKIQSFKRLVMNEIVASFYQIFDALRQQNNEVIQQATTAAQNLLANPNSASALTEILANPPNIYVKQQAALLLRRFIIIHQAEITNPAEIIQQLLNILFIEQDADLQRRITGAIGKFKDPNSQGLILTSAQQIISSGKPEHLNAAILLCRKLDLEEFLDHVDFFCTLIQQGLSVLQPKYVIDFAFKLGDQLDGDTERLAFFNQIWENTIQYVCQHLDDTFDVQFIVQRINYCLDTHPIQSPFANPNTVINGFLPLLGNEEIDLNTQLALISAIDSAVNIEDALEGVDMEEFYPLLLQKYFAVSAFAFNPTDQLAMSDVNVFQIISLCFSSDSVFLDCVFSLIDSLYGNPATRPGILLIIGYILGELSDEVRDALPQIADLLSKSVNDPIRLVRDSASYGISEFAKNYPDEMDDYVEVLGNNVLASLAQEASQDMLVALHDIFQNSSDTDSVFDQAYPFLIANMSNSHESTLQFLFPCFAELCSNSHTKIKGVFTQIIQLLFQTMQNNETLAEPACKCLGSMSARAPELFSPYVQQFVQFQNQYLQANDPSLQIVALLAYGKLLECHLSQLEPLIPQLIPILLQISSQDLSNNLKEEIIQFTMRQQQTLEENGEIEFDIEENEKENEFSPYAIPSLALKVLCSIIMRIPQIVESSLPQVLQAIQIQIKNPNIDAMTSTCQAISLFARGISKTNIQGKEQLSSQLTSCVLNLVSESEEIDNAFEGIDTLAQIIEFLGANCIGQENQQQLLNLIGAALNGKLKCQTTKDYIKEFHDALCDLINELIASLGPNAPQVFAPYMSTFVTLASHKKLVFRDFAIRILGQFVEHSSANVPPQLKENILSFAIAGIRSDSQHAAFALNQFTNGDGPLIMPRINEVVPLLHQKISQKEKKAAAYISFIDNLVGAIGELRRNVLKDQFPVEQFAPFCLRAMPARQDPTTNLDMMTFYLWLAQVMQSQPANEFAAVAIKLFMQPTDDIGGIAEEDTGVLQKVKQVMIGCLQQIPNAEAFISEVCENDPFKIQRVQSVINS
ncbi:hypothetical protein TRFO_26923 [Tritrichomonas foetus]|uniref:Importin N-terminal domain-containing protein n=1 Tax=Tritrichomonas foetus TaxID=1144522 RepID=A0A1J4K243_9EUKA|nr:hypothetical protein TRFO_26923 [Tritrichomonas foetus]|eukprot:OHT05307.1 hypothetical protein TRFO_26923 [Tritrichomonas foetus]